LTATPVPEFSAFTHGAEDVQLITFGVVDADDAASNVKPSTPKGIMTRNILPIMEPLPKGMDAGQMIAMRVRKRRHPV
jgi:hypothetical protein